MEINYEQEGDSPPEFKKRDGKLDSKQEEQTRNEDNISTTEDFSMKKEQSSKPSETKKETSESTHNKRKSKGAKKHEKHKDEKADKKAKGSSGLIQFNEVISKNHTKVIIEDIDIYFPYEPYAVQTEYTRKVNISRNNSNEEQKKKFTASIEDVENSKMLTQNFKDYIKSFDMSSSDKIMHKNIKEGVAMFAGNKVFNLMFKASEHGYNGTEYQGINHKNFHFWITTFENVLTDIADEFNPEAFSAFEYWFKCIKIMINMYKMNNKQTAEMNFKNPIDAVGARDIDHYYLSLNQEKLPYNEIKNLGKDEIYNKVTDTRKICFW